MKMVNNKISAAGFAAAAAVSLALAGSPTATAAPDLVGPGCADYTALHSSGPESVDSMSQDLVAVATSHNPRLTTLNAALSGQLNPDVNLVDTLNNGQYTVFAPTDEAFNKLPVETIEELKTDSDKLNKILTYHVVQDQLSPAKIAGPHKTLQGGDVTAAGQGNNLRINNSGLVCGGLPTLNATVYMIDNVLTPPA